MRISRSLVVLSLLISTSVFAGNLTQRRVNKSKNVSRAQTRISSGLRVNKAPDVKKTSKGQAYDAEAVGLHISNKRR